MVGDDLRNGGVEGLEGGVLRGLGGRRNFGDDQVGVGPHAGGFGGGGGGYRGGTAGGGAGAVGGADALGDGSAKRHDVGEIDGGARGGGDADRACEDQAHQEVRKLHEDARENQYDNAHGDPLSQVDGEHSNLARQK